MSYSAIKLFKNPTRIIKVLGSRSFLNWIPDEIYLKMVFKAEVGYRLNLKNPMTYNEKLQWLKINNRESIQAIHADKFKVRDYIARTVGDEFLVPLIGVYSSVDEINWTNLPEKFVIKCTHGSSSNIICADKSKLNINKARHNLKKWMKRNWFWYGREWPYKHMEPKIICEKYLEDNITDYKFMCFNGEPQLIQIHKNRGGENHTLDFYDVDWKRTDIRRDKAVSNEIISKPQNLSKMIKLAKHLSQNEIHVRVDFYEVDGKIYFGEKTYFSASGFAPFLKYEYDKLLGSYVNLPIE